MQLLEELEKGEKQGGGASEGVSYGLQSMDDNMMYNWNGTILGPSNTPFEGRIYELKIYCGDRYPMIPPVIHFRSKINMPCVNQSTGEINPSLFTRKTAWNPEKSSIESFMNDIRLEMLNPGHRKLPQPPETARFS